MVPKATINLKMILLVLTITLTKVLITEGMITKITEVVMKVILTVKKMTYKANGMGKKETLT